MKPKLACNMSIPLIGLLKNELLDNNRVQLDYLCLTRLEALDKEVRKKMYAKISQIIAEDQPAAFISFPRANHGFQANVEGIDPGMRLGWNYHKWYFVEP